MHGLAASLPPEGLKIIVTFFLSFLIGLEREEAKAGKPYAFGGVRTFPLLGLLGYALALLTGGQALALSLGLLVVGGFMMLSFQHKLSESHGTGGAGVTTEVTGLLTYVLGALVGLGYFWIAATLVVIGLGLLELKEALESLSRRIPPDEILTFTKFLLLSVVILPAVPNRDFPPFSINPFKTWLVVVAVSAVSYGSYVLQRLVHGQGGVLLSAGLGGAYSSTVTTISLGRRSASDRRPCLYAGGILLASGVMYLRLAALVGLFNRALFALLAPAFLSLAAAAILGGWMLSLKAERGAGAERETPAPKNPLELRAAFLFAALFLVMLLAAHLAVTRLGSGGIFSLAALMGLADVDPFILGMTQSGGGSTPLAVAGSAVLIAAASNNAAKGLYAFMVSERRTGLLALGGLLALAGLGLLPIVWLN